MNSRALSFGVSFALICLSGCGGGSSSGGSQLSPLTSDQKTELAAFMQSSNRATDALFQLNGAGASPADTGGSPDATEEGMISYLSSHGCTTGGSGEPDFSAPSGTVTTLFTVGGVGCPVTYSQQFDVLTQNVSAAWKFSLAVTDPAYSALNDVNGVTAQITAQVPSASTPGSNTVMTTQFQGQIHSQQLGTVTLNGTVTVNSSSSAIAGASGGTETAQVELQFPGYAVEFDEALTLSPDGSANFTSLSINGQSYSEQDYIAIVGSPFLTGTFWGGAGQ